MMICPSCTLGVGSGVASGVGVGSGVTVGSGGSSILLKLPQAHRLKANASASIIETVFFMVVPSFLRL